MRRFSIRDCYWANSELFGQGYRVDHIVYLYASVGESLFINPLMEAFKADRKIQGFTWSIGVPFASGDPPIGTLVAGRYHHQIGKVRGQKPIDKSSTKPKNTGDAPR